MVIWIVLAGIAVILILITIIANSAPSYDERKRGYNGTKGETSKTPNASKTKKNLWPIIAVILLGLLVWFGIAKKHAAPVVQQAAIEFHLKVGEETPTVEAGQGTQHRIFGNKPYKMRRILPDGGEKIYPMPSGWETLTGVEPVGRVRLIGEEEDTVVKIIKVK